MAGFSTDIKPKYPVGLLDFSSFKKDDLVNAATAVKNTVLPLYGGHTEEELVNASKPDTKLEELAGVKKPIPTKDALTAIPKLASSYIASTGRALGVLGNMAIQALPDYAKTALKGTTAGSMVNSVVNSKVGQKSGLLADETFKKMDDYAETANVQEARMMRNIDIASLLPVGSVKSIPRIISKIAKASEVSTVAKELKGLGIADHLIEQYTPVLTTTRNEQHVSDIVTRVLKENSELGTAQKQGSLNDFMGGYTKILHGTNEKFDAFDPAKMGTNEKNVAAKNAFFFTDSSETAKSYGKNIKEVYAKFDNPATIDAEGSMFGDMRDAIDEAVAKAKKEGNDAVIIKNLSDRKDWGNYEPATHYAVFDTNKLKTKSQLADIFKNNNIVNQGKQFFDNKINKSIAEKKLVNLDSDELKMHLNDPNAADHAPYAKATQDAYTKALAASKSPKVYLTVGGPGTGKTEILKESLAHKDGVMFQGTGANFDRSVSNFEEAVKAGKKPVFVTNITTPEDAWKFAQAREKNGGHATSLQYFTDRSKQAIETLKKLIREGYPVQLKDSRNLSLEEARLAPFIDNPRDQLAILEDMKYDLNHVQDNSRASSLDPRGLQGSADSGQLLKGLGQLSQDGGDIGAQVTKLIAQGKLRIVSRDGTDVYQVLKDKSWKTVKDESTALKQLETPLTPKLKSDKTSEFSQKYQEEIYKKEVEIQALEDAIDSHYGTKLLKYADKNGQLPAVGGGATKNAYRTVTNKSGGKTQINFQVKNSKYGQHGDEIINEITNGQYDTFKGQELVDQARELKSELKDSRQSLSGIKKKAKEEAVLEKFHQEQHAKNQKAEEEMRAANPNKTVAAKRPVSTIEDRGEARSLEKTIETAHEKELAAFAPEDKPFMNIISKSVTDVKDKVHIFDYFKTPERVLNKIGLGEEGKFLRKQYDGLQKELPKNIQKITDWSKRVSSEEANRDIFRFLDGEAITLKPQDQKVADEIATWLKEWAVRLDLPADKKISNYITHIFDREIKGAEFDEDLATIIQDKIPGEVYDPFLLKREGAKGYKQDTWAALDAYVKRGTRKVYMDPALGKIQGRMVKKVSIDGVMHEIPKVEQSQYNYIKAYVHSMNLRPTKLETSVDNFVKKWIGYKFGQRPVTASLKLMRQVTFRAMLMLNPSSALRNLSQGINTYATLGERYTAVGYAKLFDKGAFKELEDEGVFNASLIEDRVLSSRKKALQTLDKAGFAMFEGAERINRGAAYFGAKAKAINEGKSLEQAIEYAKEVVRKTQFSFGTIDTPVALSSDLAKTFFQFQTFTIKQAEFLGTLIHNKDWAAMARYTAAGLGFVYTAGKAIGMDPTDLIPFYSNLFSDKGGAFGTPPSLKVPVEITKALMDSPDAYGNKRTAQRKLEDVGTAALTGIVPAGSQIKKTYQGTKAVMEGGSFDRGGNLQFEQAPDSVSRAQSILFGKYSTQNARDYFDKSKKKNDFFESMKGKITGEKSMKEIYDGFQKLIKDGRYAEAKQMYDSMSDNNKDKYDKYKSDQKRLQNAELKRKNLRKFQSIRDLVTSGQQEKAITEYNLLTDEEAQAYDEMKKSGKLK